MDAGTGTLSRCIMMMFICDSPAANLSFCGQE